MSQQTRCNFCTLRDIRKFAHSTAQAVTILYDREPSDEDNRPLIVRHYQHSEDRLRGSDILVGGTFIAWLWKITDHCVCDGGAG